MACSSQVPPGSGDGYSSVLPAERGGYDLLTEYQNSYPKYYLTDGRVSGLCVEILEALAEESGLSIGASKQELTPWERIQRHFAEGTVDIVVGMKKTSTRQARYLFIDPPVYYVNTVVAARTDDDGEVRDLSGLAGETVLVPHGCATARKLRTEYPQIRLDEAGDISACVRKLLWDRGRFVVYHDLGVVSAIRDLGVRDRVRVLSGSYDRYGHHVAVSKRIPAPVVARLTAAVRRLAAKGRLEAISDRYLSLWAAGDAGGAAVLSGM